MPQSLLPPTQDEQADMSVTPITYPGKRFEQARKIVIKVGSSLVTADGRGLDEAAINNWVRQISIMCQQGRQIILVSSGAIAQGMVQLGWTQRPKETHRLQAAVAVGQMGLAQAYQNAFAQYQCLTAQILLTHADLTDRTRYLNARTTLNTLIDMGVIPIINENDTVITDEIRLGDNDTLGALVTNLVEADYLLILTDQEGLFTADPRKDNQAKLIQYANAGDAYLESIAGGTGSGIGSGGMITKVLAAKRAAHRGASTIIASGRHPDVLLRLAQGERIGSCLFCKQEKTDARKQWFLDHLRLRGQLSLDEGAIKALLNEGKSLLSVGVSKVQGHFVRGDVVSCVDSQGKEIARGLINYSDGETRRIARQPSSDIESLLGYVVEPELIHRDNLVIIR